MGGANAVRLYLINGLEYRKSAANGAAKAVGVGIQAHGSFTCVYVVLATLKLSVVDQSKIAVAMDRPKASERCKTSSEFVELNWLRIAASFALMAAISAGDKLGANSLNRLDNAAFAEAVHKYFFELSGFGIAGIW